jgi:hypothetical protein
VLQISFYCVEKSCVSIEDLISISVPKRQNSPTPHYQVFPVLDTTSPSINSNDNIPNEELNYKSLTINYAKRLIDSHCEQGSASTTCNNVNKWRVHSITLYNNDKLIVKEWYDTLSKLLNGKEIDWKSVQNVFKVNNVWFIVSGLNRPRKLLLFVNPYGKKNALKIYEKYAKPIFLLANIDVSVVITQRSNQIFDLVLEQHLDHYDGIACE